jgi:hypothetical protein
LKANHNNGQPRSAQHQIHAFELSLTVGEFFSPCNPSITQSMHSADALSTDESSNSKSFTGPQRSRYTIPHKHQRHIPCNRVSRDLWDQVRLSVLCFPLRPGGLFSWSSRFHCASRWLSLQPRPWLCKRCACAPVTCNKVPVFSTLTRSTR